MIVSLILILSLLVNGALGYAAWNMVRKQEQLEDFILNAYSKAQQALTDMRLLDERQMFELDDEVGILFREVSACVTDYALFLGVTEAETHVELETQKKGTSNTGT